MIQPKKLRFNGLRSVWLAAAVAGLGTCALGGYTWWSFRGDVPRLDGAAIPILIGIGLTAGWISGRFRDAPASWAASVLGGSVAFLANYAIQPAWPRSDTPFAEWVVLATLFLLPVIGGSHLLGAAITDRARRGARVRD